MKKYLNLTSNQAIKQFLLRDKTLVPEASEELRQKWNDLENLKGDLSVSIVIPTHRTRPDSEIDAILLKNKIEEAERMLYSQLDKRKAEVVVENIKEAQDAIDYSLNLDSLVLYANEHFASVVRLPVELEEEVLIAQEFDLRPLYKTRQQNRRYYILTISRNVVRLMEAFNDKLVKEIKNEDFPFENDYYTTDPKKLAQDVFIDNQEKEFYNTVDKLFQKYYNENPLPVILAGDVKTLAYYEEQMDEDCMIITRIHGNFDKMSYPEIMKAVEPEVVKYREEQQQIYVQQMDEAISAGHLVTDVNDMYKAAAEGAADTLYIGDTYSLDKISSGQITLVDENNYEMKASEFLPALMKVVRDSGGNVLFVEDELMDKYQGIALIRRY